MKETIRTTLSYTLAPLAAPVLGWLERSITYKKNNRKNYKAVHKHLKWYFKHFVNNQGTWANAVPGEFEGMGWNWKAYYTCVRFFERMFPVCNSDNSVLDFNTNLQNELTRTGISKYWLIGDGSAKDDVRMCWKLRKQLRELNHYDEILYCKMIDILNIGLKKFARELPRSTITNIISRSRVKVHINVYNDLPNFIIMQENLCTTKDQRYFYGTVDPQLMLSDYIPDDAGDEINSIDIHGFLLKRYHELDIDYYTTYKAKVTAKTTEFFNSLAKFSLH